MVETTAILEELSNLNPPRTEYNTQAITSALNLFSNPQLAMRVIHITGTNGKGSTAAFIEEGLFQSGYRVGKFSSPFIHCITECIKLNKNSINKDELASIYLATKNKLETNNIALTSFETLTLIMFIYFSECKIDFLILEVGMGGLDDATNVVESEFSIITNIGLEHTQWLGSSLTEIAKHKAGIIKNGITIIADNSAELVTAVKLKTKDFINVNSKYVIKTELDFDNFTTALAILNKETQEQFQVKLGMLGHFQANNFLCATEVLLALKIPLAKIIYAASLTQWPGRLQKLRHNPLTLIDVAHNLSAVKSLYYSLEEYIKARSGIIICTILKDKDKQSMLQWYRKIADHIIFCEIENQPRAESANHLALLAEKLFAQVNVIVNPSEALNVALTHKKDFILISGSTYLLRYFL